MGVTCVRVRKHCLCVNASGLRCGERRLFVADSCHNIMEESGWRLGGGVYMWSVQ